MARRLIASIFALSALGALASAPSASADGLPVPGVVTPSGGLPGPDGQRYVTTSKHGSTTIREFASGGVVGQRALPGSFTIPAIALDGSPAGISADGSTLVLIRPRSSFPQKQTRLLVLDAHKLTIERRLRLNGDFSFDAISPDGSSMYLIQYLSPHDPTRYAVRAYDLGAGKLVPDPIVDPDEHAGEMRGYPLTRVTSSDGRWAYTLYDGGGKEPFVHALDTADGKAVCVDLDGLVTPSDAQRIQMGMNSDGRLVTLSTGSQTIAVIDTGTLEARDPSVPAPAPADGGDGFPWMLVGTAAAVALIAGGAAIITRRRRESGLAAPDA
jgi:hypothetical protein